MQSTLLVDPSGVAAAVAGPIVVASSSLLRPLPGSGFRRSPTGGVAALSHRL